jgi:acyl carrier protein
MNREQILVVVQRVVREETFKPELIISELTKSEDVPGWDSLAHTRIILGLESALKKNIPIEETYYATDVGELITLIDGLT